MVIRILKRSSFIFLLLVFPLMKPVCGSGVIIIDPQVHVNIAYVPVFPAISNDPVPLGDFNSLVIPLKRAGRLFLVDAIIDGVTGNLVFDTGATGLVLNRTYFRSHPVIEEGQSNGITGSTSKIGSTMADKVIIGDLSFEKTRADLADLGHIENRRNAKIIGLMGFNMIRSFEVVIDASNNELQLHRINRKGERLLKPELAIIPDITQKIDPWHPVLIMKGEIGDKTLHFCVDTGAETNAISIQSHKSVLGTISITRRTELKGAGKASTEVLYGIMNDFRLEEHSIGNMETIIVNLEALNEAYGFRIDGMLGFGFLEKGIFTFNLVKKQVSIQYYKAEGI